MSQSFHPTSNRRQLLASASTAFAGMAWLNERTASAADPATQVADRTSKIAISSLRATPIEAKCFIRIDTNMAIFGWGEVTGLDPKVAAALADSLFELLDKENPTRIEFLWQKLYRAHRDMRGGPFMTHVLSAIDMALWDITGKLWNVPVYRLLGGPTRDKIRVYPSPKARKVGTGGPHPFAADPKDLERLVKMIQDARQKVGPDGSVMFDAHSSVPPPMLIQLASMIQPSDVLFIEEPAVPGNIEVFKRLKEAIHIPLATGERDRTIWGMIPYLHERCIDILQPDVGQTGGITQVKKIATLAEAYNTPIAPHSTCTELGVTASMHAVASIPNFLIHEAYLDGNIMPKGVANVTWKVDEMGYASLPQEPGLGVEIDEKKMAEVAANPRRRFKWPHPTAKDGSVIDY
jgi:galactonate dehydratase